MLLFLQNSFSITDIVSLIGLIFAILAVIFTGIQLRQNVIARRAQIMLSIIESYFNDSEERKMYYRLDYRNWRFDTKTFPNSEEEKAIDIILYKFQAVGKLLRIGAISVNEASLLDFEIDRVLTNPEIEKYLEWLKEEVRQHNISSYPFNDVIFLRKELSKNKSLIKTAPTKTLPDSPVDLD